ncbi:MAG: protein-export chaperone SecB [Paracoccaceae bacterium]|nr:protein-export chaperone SecB [Paracoccaceae bacterium]
MTDGNGNPPEAPGGAAAPEAQATQQPVKMQVLAQFIRDLSFENALAQKGIQGGEVTPEVQVQVSLDARKRTTEHQYEVVTKFRVISKNKVKDETLFLLELEYGGVFHVENLPEAQLHPFLLIECPRMLFPFVRRIVADITRDGGFPSVNLDSVDFLALYRQQLAQRAAQQGPEQGQPTQ